MKKESSEIKSWKISEWTGISPNPLPMTKEEVASAIKYLRGNKYPKPEDCQNDHRCVGFRPACSLGICHVAVRLCGDF